MAKFDLSQQELEERIQGLRKKIQKIEKSQKENPEALQPRERQGLRELKEKFEEVERLQQESNKIQTLRDSALKRQQLQRAFEEKGAQGIQELGMVLNYNMFRVGDESFEQWKQRAEQQAAERRPYVESPHVMEKIEEWMEDIVSAVSQRWERCKNDIKKDWRNFNSALETFSNKIEEVWNTKTPAQLFDELKIAGYNIAVDLQAEIEKSWQYMKHGMNNIILTMYDVVLTAQKVFQAAKGSVAGELSKHFQQSANKFFEQKVRVLEDRLLAMEDVAGKNNNYADYEQHTKENMQELYKEMEEQYEKALEKFNRKQYKADRFAIMQGDAQESMKEKDQKMSGNVVYRREQFAQTKNKAQEIDEKAQERKSQYAEKVHQARQEKEEQVRERIAQRQR